ncbi:tyrosine-type recombinase/integrase [Candidatus Woesearchaeota archaeon]|nr:tyrosine-type recombinase/integrase [Candidatus Woesearchaeota archaeon]
MCVSVWMMMSSGHWLHISGKCSKGYIKAEYFRHLMPNPLTDETVNTLKGYVLDLKLRNLSSQTVDAYEYANRKFLGWAQKEPKFVRTSDIKAYINCLIDKSRKPRTINLTIAALCSFYDGYLGRRLFTRIRRLKLPKAIPVVLSKQEINSLIHACENPMHKLMIRFLYSTGVRSGELVKVRSEHIDFDNMQLRVQEGKGKKDRLTIISEQLCNELTDKDGYLFMSNRGKHITRETAENIVRGAARKAGIRRRVFPHAIRASFASHLYDAGVPIQKIQALLGHSSARTTSIYIRSSVIHTKGIGNPLDAL